MARKKRQIKKPVNKGGLSKRNKKSNRCLALPGLSSTLISNIEDNLLNECPTSEFVYDKEKESTALNKRLKSSVNISPECKLKIEDQDQTAPEAVNSDDSKSSSEEKGATRKDRKSLPLIFDQLNCSNNDSSENTKEAGRSKCVYLGDRETLVSFWDKCRYECFTSKRCVAGDKPKREYRKKSKTQRPRSKKRKQLDVPLSCIDTRGIAVTSTADNLSRYEMLLYMDPLADSVTPMQKKDFEMTFRMVKPSDIFALNSDSNNDESTDYTNSDTD